MRKAPIVLALAVLGSTIALDRESFSEAAAHVQQWAAKAKGVAEVAPAPVAARLEPEVEVEIVGAEPPPVEVEEPAEMAADWGELKPDEESEDDTSADEPEPEAGPPVLVSIARETWVFAEPRWRSRRLGYLRAGASVTRIEKAVSYQG